MKVRRRVLRVGLAGPPSWLDDEVAVELPLEVFVGNEFLRVFLCSPGMERELAVGHLVAEGVIDSVDEIDRVFLKGSRVSIALKTDRRLRLEALKTNRLISTSCGSTYDQPNLLARLKEAKVASSVSVKPEDILKMVQELNNRSQVFKSTGGTHSAMVCDSIGRVLAHAEDVGRHNAVDKVIGSLVLERRDPSDCVIVSSGRQSRDMVLKAARAGVPVIVSQAGPIGSGITAADESGVTLVCFVRGQRMNIYTHPERVRTEPDTSK